MKNPTSCVNYIELTHLPIGKVGRVMSLQTTGLARRRMLDLGVVEGTLIQTIRKSPLGDPIAYNIRGAMIALRKEESSQILIKIMD